MENLPWKALLKGSSSTLPDCDDAAYERALNQRDPVAPREGVVCEACGNYEYVWVVKNASRYCRPCACKMERDNLRRLRGSGLENLIARCTFERYEAREHWQREAKEKVMRFVTDENRGWLLLSGQSGAGKSHLCTAAAEQFIKNGLETRYMRWLDESVALKALVGDEKEYFKRLNRLKTCKVLYIDDLFKSNKAPTDPDIRLAFDLLDYRYCNPELITMISTERYMEELLKIDQALGGRIYERTREYRVEFGRGAQKNWRLQHG